MIDNFIADFQKGGDFLKSHRAKWSCKQVAFFYVQPVKGAKYNIFMCKLRAWWLILKPVG